MVNSPGYRKYFPCLFFFGISCLYFLWRGKSYLFDGLLYAAVSSREHPQYLLHLFHPNHFIFNPLGLVFGDVAKSLHVPLENSYHTLQLMNSLFGVAGLALFYIWLRRCVRDYFLALWGVAFLGISYLYWWHSIEGQVYIVNAFFLVILFLSARAYALKKEWSYLIFFGLASALAMLAHQANIFIAAAALALLGDWKKLAAYIGILFVLVAIPYLSVAFFLHGARDFPTLMNWLVGVGVSYNSGLSMSPYWNFNPLNVLVTIRSLFRVFWYDLIPSHFWQLAVGLGMAIFAFLANRRSKDRSFFLFNWIFIVIYILFYSFWNVGNINYLLGIAILLLFYTVRGIAAFLAEKRNRLAVIIKLFLSIVLIITFTYNNSILKPRRDIKNNRNYLIAEALASVVTERDVLIVAGVSGYQTGKVYLPYFYNIPCLALDVLFIRKGKVAGLNYLQNFVIQNPKRHEIVYVLEEVFTDKEARKLIRQYWDVSAEELDSVFTSVPKDRIVVWTRNQEPITVYRIGKK